MKKAGNEPSEAVVGADGVKQSCHQWSLTCIDIDNHRSPCGVKSQIFKLLAYIGYSSTFIVIL